MEVIGYLHVLVESMEVKDVNQPIHAKISLGEVAKVDTTPKPSGSTFNEVFLIEVPTDPSRLILTCYEGENKKGECRYDVKPFYEHEGNSHTIES